MDANFPRVVGDSLFAVKDSYDDVFHYGVELTAITYSQRMNAFFTGGQTLGLNKIVDNDE